MNQTQTSSLIGALAMVATGCVYAFINVMTQHITGTPAAGLPGLLTIAKEEAISSTALAFWQYGLALLAFLPGIIAGGRDVLRTRHLGLHIVRVVLATLGVQCFIAALGHGVPIWQVIALDMVSPFLIVLGAGLFLGEETGWKRITATMVGFIGALIILAPWTDRFSAYSLLPIGAAAFWAGSSILTKQLTRSEGTTSITIYMLLLLTPINAVFAGIASPSAPVDGFAIGSGHVWAIVLLLALLTALAQWLLTAAYARADAAFLQTFDYVRLPVNVIAGLVVFTYAPDGNLWLGAALILAASLYLLWMDKATRGAEPAAA